MIRVRIIVEDEWDHTDDLAEARTEAEGFARELSREHLVAARVESVEAVEAS